MNTTTGLHINQNGELKAVTLNTDSNGSNLQAMKKVLDVRTVDVVSLPDGVDCWVDDEALLVSEPTYNVVLTATLFKLAGERTSPIFSDGLFLGVNSEGASISLTPEQDEAVRYAHRWATRVIYQELGRPVPHASDGQE